MQGFKALLEEAAEVEGRLAVQQLEEEGGSNHDLIPTWSVLIPRESLAPLIPWTLLGLP